MTLPAEAEAIVRALAQERAIGSLVSWQCQSCWASWGQYEPERHAEGCLVVRAISWVRRADAEREGGK